MSMQLESTGINPVQCTSQTACSHKHGPSCGHEPVPHGDHIDYLVNGRLHHPHGIIATTMGRYSWPDPWLRPCL
jgi:hypothetical protein